MTAKIRTGVHFFDKRYGGSYRNRAMLVCGRSGSGKSLFGFQFIAQGVKDGSRCLLLSGRPAADVVIYGDGIGLHLGEAVENGSFIVLEYNDYIPGPNSESHLTLPPEGFVQLQEMIEANGVQRLVLDTCLPWVTLPTTDALASHCFSLVRSLDRLGVSTVLTLPKPVSPSAFKLKSILEDIVPVSVSLLWDDTTDTRTWIVNKYLGEARLDDRTEFSITKGIGLQAVGQDSATVKEKADPLRAGESPPPSPVPDPPANPPAPARDDASEKRRVRFADAILGNAK